jgi:hypothetical protein
MVTQQNHAFLEPRIAHAGHRDQGLAGEILHFAHDSPKVERQNPYRKGVIGACGNFAGK